jgi:hypothetical protein
MRSREEVVDTLFTEDFDYLSFDLAFWGKCHRLLLGEMTIPNPETMSS